MRPYILLSKRNNPAKDKAKRSGVCCVFANNCNEVANALKYCDIIAEKAASYYRKTMKRIEADQIAERGHQLAQRMTTEYGGLTVPESRGLEAQIPRQALLQNLKGGRIRGLSEDITLIKPHDPHNLSHLTSPAAIGRTFGIMSRSQNKIVHVGIITARTKPGELHFTRLSGGGGVRLEDFKGIDDLGRITVEVGSLIQHPNVGTEVADASRGTAGEIGHTMQGLSAFTDPEVLASLQSNKSHLVHGWAETTGIAAALTNRSSGISAFAVKTENGILENGFAPDLIITEATPDYLLVDHTVITDERESTRLRVSPAELAAGMGMIAAESQLEQSGLTFEDQVMKVMAKI